MKRSAFFCCQLTRYQLFYVFIICLAAAFPHKSYAQNRDEITIRKLLADQIVAWNNNSIEDFMKGYWQSDSLMFVGKNGLKYGYKTTLENYKKSYPDTSARGKLYFDILQMKRLSKEYYYVTGKWLLMRSIGNLDGYFTLLFKKIKNHWLIIADHSR